MTLVEIQRLLNGTGSVTEVLEAIDKVAQPQEETEEDEELK